MRTQVYIHAGTPKTGTSTIQQFLFENSDELRKHGCLYPVTGRQFNAHHPFAGLFLGHDKVWIKPCEQDDIRRRLYDEIRMSRCNKVILSSEVFYYIKRLGVLEDYFNGCDFFFLVFLRRQDDWLESIYRQDLKSGEADLDVQAFLEKRIHEADYLSRIEGWASTIGREKIILRLFQAGDRTTSLEKQFLEACNLDWSDRFLVTPASNTSLNQDCLRFLACSPDKCRYGSNYDRLARLLAEYSKHHNDAPEITKIFSPSQRIEILTKCRAGNEELSRRYFGHSDGKLFDAPEPDPADPWSPYPGLSTEKALEIAFFLFHRTGIIEQTTS